MKKTTTFRIVTYAVILVVIFLFDTANAQHSTERMFKAPFLSALNMQYNSKRIIKNAERDIVFIENLGQIRDIKGNEKPDILFLTRSQGVDMYITGSGISYVFRKTTGYLKSDNLKTNFYRLDMEFVGMNKNFQIKKEFVTDQRFNYYTSKYQNGISPKAYKKITLLNIYDGINIVYYEKEGKLKYDFIVKSGADVGQIKMKYKGAGKVFLDKDGNVTVTTSMGEIKEEKPFTYSKNTGLKIEGGYKVIDDAVLFDIAEYNENEDIIIDPYRLWATYYGGGSGDIGYSICIDNSSNLYVTGYTSSADFPTQVMSGAYNQTTINGSSDMFILKFDIAGARVWATYYGGSGYDVGRSICTDNTGNLYVTGYTSSSNFPLQTLSGAYNQSTLSGSNDLFIIKFSLSGIRTWATYYGGSSYEYGYDIDTDNTNNLFVTGYTRSSNFPTKTLSGAYNQTSMSGYADAFLLKFNSNSARIWATYYGGSSYEYGYNIHTDNSNNLYATGYTTSSNFPTKTLSGAYNQTNIAGGGDVYILKFNSSGSRTWATYYGGNNYDYGYSICTDNSDNLYVTGYTRSSNFPLLNLPGAYNQTYPGSYMNTFILKFNSSGARAWATYYGGNNYDYGYSICTDNSDNLYVTGYTYSTNFPTQSLPGAYNQTTLSGNNDAFLIKFNSSGARIWATFYGGSFYDYGYNLCIDISDNLYATGYTRSYDFPLQNLPEAYNQSTLNGSWDAYILMFSNTATNISNNSNIPKEFKLYNNFPNPFNPTTNIKFDIPKSARVIVIIYDILGKKVVTLINGKLSAGSYNVDWDGSGSTNGVYFCKFMTDDYVDVKKMLLVK